MGFYRSRSGRGTVHDAAQQRHTGNVQRQRPGQGRGRRYCCDDSAADRSLHTGFDRTSVEGGLKGGGYPAFLAALRKAPQVGTVGIGDQKFAIRYAREEKTEKGRTITLVTDKPMFFVGGGSTDAKPRAGYKVGAVRIEVDDVGLGSGTMAAAARIKPGPGGVGVAVDDYADQPIKLVTVSRQMR